ncbi:hypothetical protein [Streptomyces sp. NPDC047014]|uniref:hypothetical protein n=1 Tax=Streptomyces sp. NPDC047014 TaxID=3155736 RepID=UPI0033F75A6E
MTSPPQPSPPRGRSRPARVAAVAAIAVAAAGIGYLAAGREPASPAGITVEMAGKPGTNPHPEVTRTSGVSRIRSDSPGDPVKVRPCPGLAPYGTHDCPEASVVFVPDGTPAEIRCWTDSSAPEGYPADHKRWFYVVLAPGSPKPGLDGYIYSALIPVAEQIIAPTCTSRHWLEVHPPSPAPPDPGHGPAEAAAPRPSPLPATPAPAPTTRAPQPATPGPATPEPPRAEPPRPAPRTVREQSGSHGSPAFADPHGAKGPSGRIPAHTWVDVECRVYAPEIESANPDGWWYRIATGAWAGRYAVANTFMNGDAPGQKPPTHTDLSVPVC